jgi:hypothetical protein
MSEERTLLDEAVCMSERLSPADPLRLIGLLSAQVRQRLDESDEPVDIRSTSGLGAELWQEIDVDAYPACERQSWEPGS